MYRVKQSTTTPYNPCGNSTCERFNHTLHDFLKTLDKEQKANWPLYLPSVVFAYNAMPRSVTGYQPYKLILEAKCQLSAMLGSDWLKIMTSIHKARVHG